MVPAPPINSTTAAAAARPSTTAAAPRATPVPNISASSKGSISGGIRPGRWALAAAAAAAALARLFLPGPLR